MMPAQKIRVRPGWMFLVLALGGGALPAGRSAGADHSWTGGTGPFWTSAGNWTNGAPAPGDNLFFLPGPLNVLTTNNYPAGTVFNKITLGTSITRGYTLAGNRLQLTNGLTSSGALLTLPAQLDLDVDLGPAVFPMPIDGMPRAFSATGSVIFNGQLTMDDTDLELTNSRGWTFNGVVSLSDSSGFGIGEITKRGAGSLIFSASSWLQGFKHAATPYDPGPYTLSAPEGSLRLDGVATNSLGGVMIGVGGSADGRGTVDSLVVWSSGTFSPGDAGPGIFHAGQAWLFGTLTVELNGPAPGVGYDQLVGSYTVEDTSQYCQVGAQATLNPLLGYTPQLGDSFLIIQGSGVGAFLNLPYNSVLDTTNGVSLGISYWPDNGRGVLLTTLRVPDSPFVLWKGSTNLYADRRWSSTNNWAGGVAPTNGSLVEFTPYQFRDMQRFVCGEDPTPPPLTNDLPSGLSLRSLLFTGTNYALYGNALTLTEGLTSQVSLGTNYCNLDLVTVGSLGLEIDAGGVLSLGGSFNGSGTLHKRGGGTLVYTGTTANAFIGSMSLESGTLRMEGTFLDGSFTINGGLLGGTGTVSSVTVNGGTLNPGDGPGILHIQGDLTLNFGAVFEVELNGPVPGSYDQVQVNGSVKLNGATLAIAPGYAAPVGTAWLIVVNDASDPVVGTFAGLPEGAVFFAGGQYFSISYKAGTGANDVVVTRVSPPGSLTGISLLETNAVQLQGMGGSGVDYTIQANTNLATTNWLDIGTAPADGSGHFIFNDTNVSSYPSRFFRIAR